jgi:hypothetical protein
MVTADVLALLEDGPHSTTELARWLDTTPQQVVRFMADRAAEGLVRRDHGNGRWCRVVITRDVVAAPAAVVLDQLAFAPKAAPEIARAISVSRAAVDRTLATLLEAGEVKIIGTRAMQKFALRGWTAAHVQRATAVGTSAKRRPTADQRRAAGSSSGTVPVAEFTNEATAVTPKGKPSATDADGRSWWVKGAAPDAPRAVFVDAAKQRDADQANDPRWRRLTMGQTGALDDRGGFRD